MSEILSIRIPLHDEVVELDAVMKEKWNQKVDQAHENWFQERGYLLRNTPAYQWRNTVPESERGWYDIYLFHRVTESFG